MRKKVSKLFFIILTLVLTILTFNVVNVRAEGGSGTEFIHARPSVNGKLHVEGIHLVDESGKPVMLRGISTHGLTWFSEFADNDVFRQLLADWDCKENEGEYL